VGTYAPPRSGSETPPPSMAYLQWAEGGADGHHEMVMAKAPSMTELLHGSAAGAVAAAGGRVPGPPPPPFAPPPLVASPSSSVDGSQHAAAASPTLCGRFLSSALPGACTAQLRRAELVLLHPGQFWI